jgi:hypothetical protein
MGYNTVCPVKGYLSVATINTNYVMPRRGYPCSCRFLINSISEAFFAWAI